jgi:pyridoxine 5-phosphate synthase
VALEVRPASVTLVPERREELTTEGGLDVQSRIGEVGEMVRALGEAGVRSCLFLDPDLEQIKAAHRVGARAVEIHTGRYAEHGPDHENEVRRIEDAIRMAAKLHLEIGVGHGLDYRNVARLARIGEIGEFSIGHSIVSRALFVGLQAAVREMKSLVGRV